MTSVFQNNFGNEFTVYPFENSYHTFIRTPQNLQYTANDLILISIILTILICVIIAVISVHETGRETGIYLSLGFSEKYIIIINILEEKEEDGKTVPSKLSIKLNQNCGQLNFKPVRKAERTSLYVALDLAEYWLKEALEMDP